MALKVKYPNYASGLVNKIQLAIGELNDFYKLEDSKDVKDELAFMGLILRGVLQRASALQNGKPADPHAAIDLHRSVTALTRETVTDAIGEILGRITPDGELDLGVLSEKPITLTAYVDNKNDALELTSVRAVSADYIFSKPADGREIMTPTKLMDCFDLSMILERLEAAEQLVKDGKAEVKNGCLTCIRKKRQ